MVCNQCRLVHPSIVGPDTIFDGFAIACEIEFLEVNQLGPAILGLARAWECCHQIPLESAGRCTGLPSRVVVGLHRRKWCRRSHQTRHGIGVIGIQS